MKRSSINWGLAILIAGVMFLTLSLAKAARKSRDTSVGRSLAWDYPANTSGIVFEIWRAEGVSTNWVKVGETVYTNWSFSPTGEKAFFAVRARDTKTSLVSDWATVGH